MRNWIVFAVLAAAALLLASALPTPPVSSSVELLSTEADLVRLAVLDAQQTHPERMAPFLLRHERLIDLSEETLEAIDEAANAAELEDAVVDWMETAPDIMPDQSVFPLTEKDKLTKLARANDANGLRSLILILQMRIDNAMLWESVQNLHTVDQFTPKVLVKPGPYTRNEPVTGEVVFSCSPSLHWPIVEVGTEPYKSGAAVVNPDTSRVQLTDNAIYMNLKTDIAGKHIDFVSAALKRVDGKYDRKLVAVEYNVQ